MGTIDKVLKYLKGKKAASGKEIADFLGISRQAVNKHLKALIGNGEIIKEGVTRGSVYKIAGKTIPEKRLGKSYILKGLEEDSIFNELELFLNLKRYLRENVLDIVRYAFTELLNNAIEHSYSKIGDIEAIVEGDPVEIRVFVNADLTGSSFSQYSALSSTDVDISSTSL
ncbi:MAG: HTH domain-containing protein, partial [bacterium]